MMPPRRATVLRYVLMLVVGLVGAVLFTVALHLYQDHANLHVLIEIEAARQRAIQQPPSAGAPRAPVP